MVENLSIIVKDSSIIEEGFSIQIFFSIFS